MEEEEILRLGEPYVANSAGETNEPGARGVAGEPGVANIRNEHGEIIAQQAVDAANAANTALVNEVISQQEADEVNAMDGDAISVASILQNGAGVSAGTARSSHRVSMDTSTDIRPARLERNEDTLKRIADAADGTMLMALMKNSVEPHMEQVRTELVNWLESTVCKGQTRISLIFKTPEAAVVDLFERLHNAIEKSKDGEDTEPTKRKRALDID